MQNKKLIIWRRSDAQKPKLHPSDKFTPSEFECSCGCESQQIAEELIEKLSLLRFVLKEKFGKVIPIYVNSGYRCQKHNDSISNSSRDSRHVLGWAADIRVDGLDPVLLGLYAAGVGLRVGYYKNFVHVDVDHDRRHFPGGY